MRATERQLTSRRAVQGAVLASLVAGLLLCAWLARGLSPGAPVQRAQGALLHPSPSRAPAAFSVAPERLPAEAEPMITPDVALSVGARGVASCRLQGRVTRAGAPVAGVEVTARQLGGEGLRAVRIWDRIVTDRDGRFEAEYAAGAAITLSACDARSASAEVVVGAGVDVPADLELRLVDHFSIRGRLLDAAGSPVPGIDVQALRVGRPPGRESLQPHAPDEVATTDASGAFELLLPASGRFRVQVAPESGLISNMAVAALRERSVPVTVELWLAQREP